MQAGSGHGVRGAASQTGATWMSDGLVARLSTIGSQARLSRLILRKGGIGVADQALISLASFVTMVLLARGLSPEEFGSFTLVYAALLFAGSVQSALITQPHAVLAATRSGSAYTRFTGDAGARTARAVSRRREPGGAGRPGDQGGRRHPGATCCWRWRHPS